LVDVAACSHIYQQSTTTYFNRLF